MTTICVVNKESAKVLKEGNCEMYRQIYDAAKEVRSEREWGEERWVFV